MIDYQVPQKKKPNFLIIMVDEERFPPPYEDEAIKQWRKENLKAQNFLKEHGVEFLNHYAASTACSPSRTTLYTGQYPSLHGVTQTDGGGATASAPEMFWLDPNTVPTFGDYLRKAGYQTFWKGKWHASHGDIEIPGTHDSFLSYENNTGVPIPENEEIYLKANRLNDFGFNSWIGPEPHGTSPHNSGSSAAKGVSGRDEIYSEEVVNLIRKLEEGKTYDQPWAMVASFVNPHDIALFGAYTRLLPAFNFDIDSSVPTIPPAPTAQENLNTKPRVQEGYKEIYPQMIQPLADTETYRRLYYSLQLRADREIYKVLEAISNSIFYNDTIIIYTSDHGDMLGSHGGLFQKWYQAYEESIHVPFIIHNPTIIPESRTVDTLTSHVDIMPTLLSLAGIDDAKALEDLRNSHTEAHPLVGRDLSPLILGEGDFENQPIYFMTDDDPSKNLAGLNPTGKSIEPITQPSHIETVVVKLPTGDDRQLEVWKYSRYFDNPQFWSSPGDEDETTNSECSVSTSDNHSCSLCINTIKTTPTPDELEMYNITQDPIEANNLVNPEFSNPETRVIEVILENLLAEQCRKKRLYPSSGDVPGKPSCTNPSHDFINL
jgi:arylsulfatase A-like enzyme